MARRKSTDTPDENRTESPSIGKVQGWLMLRDSLRVEQAQWVTMWDQVAQFCIPQMVDNVRQSIQAITNPAQRPQIYPQMQNSVAIDSLNVMAGGCKAWLMPGGPEGWGGVWEPQGRTQRKSQAAKDWCADCSERAIDPMDEGGFFAAGHQMFLYLGAFGTCGFLVDDSDDLPFYCEAVPPSAFVCQRNHEGSVVTAIFTYVWPAKTIIEKFQNMPGARVPERIIKLDASKVAETRFEVVRVLYKRTPEEQNADRPDEPEDQLIGSCWIFYDTKEIMAERGYPEMPFVAPRWDEWNGLTYSSYGTSPAMIALADCKGVNLMDMLTAAYAEVQVNPPQKVNVAQTAAIDYGPGGITPVVDPNHIMPLHQSNAGATGWLTTQEAFTSRKERQIRNLFHADLFQAITPIVQEREISIPVMEQMRREAADKISPAMGRYTREFSVPIMKRIFMILYRNGHFDEAPEELWDTVGATGKQFMEIPRVVAQNRMSAALHNRHAFAFNSALARAAGLAQIMAQAPGLLNIYKVPMIQRDLDRGDGLPVDWHNSEEEMAQLAEEEQRAQQNQMAMTTAAQAIASHPGEVAGLMGMGQQTAA